MYEKKQTPERLPLSTTIAAELLVEQLREIYPQVFSEDRVDLAKLQAMLGETIDTGPERYGLTWTGKRDAFRNVQTPSVATLRPQRDESIEWDHTSNLIIEGDNLEILKLLQKSYHGQVKMIYIDPPYNTGNEFIYPDTFREGLDDYLRYSGQLTENDLAVSTNRNTSGRYHSTWLNMMYPRLFLARQLLKEDGIIFISIDDHEVHNLRLLMDEIFGEENFIDCVIWKKRYGGGAKEKYLVSMHEYVLMYSRSKVEIPGITIPTSEEAIERYYKDRDENFSVRGPFRTHPLEATKSMGERKNLVFGIIAPDGTEIMPKRQWLWSRERVKEALRKGELAFLRDKDGNWTVHSKQYLKDELGSVRTSKAFSIIDDVFTQHGTNEIIDLFGDAQVFPFPKPSRLIRKLIEIGTTPNGEDLILDFFAGSGTTAHATYAMNKDDGGNRRFILVQLPERTDSINYPTITDITRERVRRVIDRLNSETTEKLGLDATRADRGFRAFKLDSSNFKIWSPDVVSNTETDLSIQLTLYASNLQPNRSNSDRLFELILKMGLPLSSKIDLLPVGEDNIFSVGDGALIVCLAPHVDRDLVRELFTLPVADNRQRSVTFLFLDSAFDGKDSLKTNAVLEAQSHGITFKTV
jgi:adenine-specific DNA-methyltransferase